MLIKHIKYTNLSQAGGVEAEYPNSFGYNPHLSLAPMSSFDVKTQIMSDIKTMDKFSRKSTQLSLVFYSYNNNNKIADND